MDKNGNNSDDFVLLKTCQKHRLDDAYWKANMTEMMYDVQTNVRELNGKRPPKKPDTTAPMLTVPIPLTSRDLCFVMDKKSAFAFAVIIGLSIAFLIIYTNIT